MQYLRAHPKQMYKNRMSLSEDDVKKLQSQIEFDRKLKDIRETEIKRGWDKVQRLSNNLNTISNLLTYSKNIYNTTAEINNMLIDSGKMTGKKMTKIGQGGGNQNQNDNKDKKD